MGFRVPSYRWREGPTDSQRHKGKRGGKIGGVTGTNATTFPPPKLREQKNPLLLGKKGKEGSSEN